MALTTEEAALLVQYRAAYAQLIAGSKISEISSNGRTVKYGQGDLARLEAEIARLEAKALEVAPCRRRGAVRFTL